MAKASNSLVLPPIMYGEETVSDAIDHAVARAVLGCDGGLVSYRLESALLQAAMVFAPEVCLTQAMAMLPLCGVSFQNALGLLAPPEVSVHLGWTGEIYINAARCGRMRARAGSENFQGTLDWLVVGFDLPLLPPDDEPGYRPDETALFAEGCADVKPPLLVEAWARHTLSWINRWETEGNCGLHAEWRKLAHGLGEEFSHGDKTGTFMGVDEDFGMLLRFGDTTKLIPLTAVLEESS